MDTLASTHTRTHTHTYTRTHTTRQQKGNNVHDHQVALAHVVNWLRHFVESLAVLRRVFLVLQAPMVAVVFLKQEPRYEAQVSFG